MAATEHERPSPYPSALERARALGRADGDLAAGFEPAGDAAVPGPRCHGLDPDDLARLVWGSAPGPAPAGVRLNAPLWYAQGFREALAVARTTRHRRTGDGDVPAGHGRPPAGSAPLSRPGLPEPS